MLWKDRVKKARKDKGLTLEEVAKRVGVSTSTIFKLERGELKNVNIDFAEKTANVLGIPIEEFLDGVRERGDGQESPKVIPLYEHVGCGVPAFAADEIVDYIPFDGNKNPDDYFAMVARGNSMEPMVSDGDTIIFKRQPAADAGDYAAVCIEEQDFLFKKVCMDTTGMTLKSLNPSYDPIFYSWEDAASLPVRVIGKLVEVRKQIH